MKWTKLHRDVWLDARLRVHPVEVRCLLIDLQALSDEDGAVTEGRQDIALLSGLSLESLQRAIDTLQRLGLVQILDNGNVAVTSCVSDAEYRDSRRAGGVAARDAGKMPKRCPTDAEAMPSDATASPSGSSSGSSSGSLTSGKESAERKPRRTVRIDPATIDLPAKINYADVRAALTDYLATRKGGAWDEKLAAVRLKQLDEWGRERAIAALRHSVGYQGLFEPSTQKGYRNSTSQPSEPAIKPIDPAIVQDFIRRREAANMAQGSGHLENVDPARSQVPYRANGKAV